MNCYEQLIDESSNDVFVIEKHFLSKAKGLCKGRKIGISKDIDTSAEKACVLAEELGHYHTTYGNILDLSDTSNRKQELRARAWAYDKLIGLSGIISCFEVGCRSLHEMAEHLEVTEEFLKETIERYRQKYGTYTTIKNYIIYFEPTLGVMKLTGHPRHL